MQAIVEGMRQIYKPSKDYANETDANKQTLRIAMLKDATGSWVGELDHQQKIRER